MPVQIPLTRGYVATVDEADFELLAAHRWSAFVTRGRVYAIRTQRKKPRMIFMHRVILNAPKGVSVDHRDGDSLNNTRGNLRFATNAENCRNTAKKRNAASTSQYKGVGYRAKESSWRAKITVNYKRIYLGNYHSEEDAARAYDAAARHYFGEFAQLNFPDETPATLGEALAKVRSKQSRPGRFRGVTRYRDGNRWMASCYQGGKRIHLGIFATEEDAARAYDAAVIERGTGRSLNFPHPP